MPIKINLEKFIKEVSTFVINTIGQKDLKEVENDINDFIQEMSNFKKEATPIFDEAFSIMAQTKKLCDNIGLCTQDETIACPQDETGYNIQDDI